MPLNDKKKAVKLMLYKEVRLELIADFIDKKLLNKLLNLYIVLT